MQRRSRRSKIYGLRLYTPRTTAASSRRVTCLLLPTAGGSLRQNPGKVRLLIQAVRKVTSAPAHFLGSWRAFVCGEVIRTGAAGDELQRFIGGDSWLSETRPALMPRKKKSSRLERLEVICRRNGGHVVEGDSR